MCSIRYVIVLTLVEICLVSALPVETGLLVAQPLESLKTASSIGYGYGYGLGLYYPYHGYDSWGVWGYPYGYGYGHGYGSGLYGYWW